MMETMTVMNTMTMTTMMDTMTMMTMMMEVGELLHNIPLTRDVGYLAPALLTYHPTHYNRLQPTFTPCSRKYSGQFSEGRSFTTSKIYRVFDHLGSLLLEKLKKFM